jgi:hypothetical protein
MSVRPLREHSGVLLGFVVLALATVPTGRSEPRTAAFESTLVSSSHPNTASSRAAPASPTATTRASAFLTYEGNATVNDFGTLQGGGGGTKPGAAVWGTVTYDFSWKLIAVVYFRVAGVEDNGKFTLPPDSHIVALTNTVSYSNVESEMLGRVEVNEEAGCPFGAECPQPKTSSYFPPCSVEMYTYVPWLERGGAPSAAVLDGKLTFSAWNPSDADDVDGTSDNHCISAIPGPLLAGTIYNWSVPIRLEGGPQPKVDPVKLRQYKAAYHPTATFALSQITSHFSKHFDVTWQWRAAGNQIGNPKIPAVGKPESYLLNVDSTMTWSRFEYAH